MQQEVKQAIAHKVSLKAKQLRKKPEHCEKCGKLRTFRGLTLYRELFVCENCLISKDTDLILNPYASRTMLSLATEAAE